MIRSAAGELVIHRFVPSSTQWPPSRRAVVVSDAGSEPASGSVRPKLAMVSPDAMPGSHFCLCSWVPASTRICPARPLFVPNIERKAGAA